MGATKMLNYTQQELMQAELRELISLSENVRDELRRRKSVFQAEKAYFKMKLADIDHAELILQGRQL